MITRRPRARQDLLDHYIYIGQDDVDAAERFLDHMEETLARLARAPGLGRAWPSRNRRLAGLRVLPLPRFPSYLIFYRAAPRGIEVVRVLHGARNLAVILDDE